MVYSMATVYFDRNHPTTTNALSHAYQKLRVMVLLSVAAHSFCFIYYWFLFVLLAPMQGQIDAGIGWVVLILWLLFLPGIEYTRVYAPNIRWWDYKRRVFFCWLVSYISKVICVPCIPHISNATGPHFFVRQHIRTTRKRRVI
jgi:hypothetical protein